MTEARSASNPCNQKRTAMHCAMMRTAQRQQMAGSIGSALRARLDVVQIEKGRIVAPGNATAPLVSLQHKLIDRVPARPRAAALLGIAFRSVLRVAVRRRFRSVVAAPRP